MKEIVELGRKSNEIGKVMEIINNIADQTKLIAFNAASQISLSTKQQKTGTDQVLLALKEIVNGTRQSSAAIKQTSSVTHKLSEMSEKLNELVNRFKLD